MNENHSVSVIIRVKNEERWIGHAIQSVLDNLYKPEIVIVNNYSSDASMEIIKRFSEDKNLKDNTSRNYTKIKIVNLDSYTPGKSINLGVKESSNKYVMILSAHCVLRKIDINKLLNEIQKYVSIFGNQIPIWDGKKIFKRYLWSHFIESEVENMYSQLENRYFLHNAASFFKRDFLIENPFDEELQSKEDRYWAIDIINKGFKTLYDPSFVVEHHYTPNGATWKGLG
mgnify:CR=1 FL=1